MVKCLLCKQEDKSLFPRNQINRAGHVGPCLIPVLFVCISNQLLRIYLVIHTANLACCSISRFPFAKNSSHLPLSFFWFPDQTPTYPLTHVLPLSWKCCLPMEANPDIGHFKTLFPVKPRPRTDSSRVRPIP